ncbi:MAG TPA: KEOPS complex subunit Pcc1 [Methanomassiliicoccales archaeon]|jgi:KEOPS complex subunit Pcc1|nr:KEOPS complex subunit Pcc1 [Methanomassiliicoccales archaeon]HRU11032.1 KEOPS complex subunit Pcc1 [Methanomassiliicoccales archaeon]
MFRATLVVRSPFASNVANAIGPEAGREIPRTRAEVHASQGSVTLRLDADDLPALRAALNSYIRWMCVAEKMSETVGDIDG